MYKNVYTLILNYFIANKKNKKKKLTIIWAFSHSLFAVESCLDVDGC